MVFRKIFFLTVLLSSISFGEAAFSYSLENDLRTLLFTTNSYNKFTRPLAQVTISAQLNLLTLTSLQWTDSRLSWSTNPTYSTDVPVIYSTEDYVWIPSLSVTNSVDDIGVISDDTVVIRVASDGTLTWTPGGVYLTSCTTDVTFYPFDIQTCSVLLTTWGYTNIEIALTGVGVDTSYYDSNGEWEFVSSSTDSTTRTSGSNTLPQISFNLTFRRRPAFQVMNTILPMVLLAFLKVFVFQLPPDSGEKMGYALTTLLAFAVYLTLVTDHIPQTSINTSCLSVYLVIIFALGILAVLLTIYVLKCHHNPENKPIPTYLRKLCIAVAKLECENCCCKNNDAVEELAEGAKTPVGEFEPELTWSDVASILDSFIFKAYILFLSFLTVCVLLTFIISYYK